MYWSLKVSSTKSKVTSWEIEEKHCSDFIGYFQHSTFLSVLLRTKCYTEGCSKQVSTANSCKTKRKSRLNSHQSCAWTWNCIRRPEKAPRLSMLQLSDQTKTHKNQIPLPTALRKPSSCIFFVKYWMSAPTEALHTAGHLHEMPLFQGTLMSNNANPWHGFYLDWGTYEFLLPLLSYPELLEGKCNWNV